MQPFAGLSVRENIAVGAHLRHRARDDALGKAERVARRVGLGDRLDAPASGLTVSGRKRLELARALATEPSLLLLDEVLAGLNPSEVRDVIPVIAEIRRAGVTILMVEHVMQAVMSLCERVFVLAQGRVDRRGPPAAVTRDPKVDRGLSRSWRRGAARRARGVAWLNRCSASAASFAGYGDIEVLRGIDLDVAPGEIVAVLGSNGVGKTTLNKTLSGVLSARSRRDPFRRRAHRPLDAARRSWRPA